MTPAVLAALAVLLAGPVPALLARWPRLRRTPRTALLLWQGVALAGVLAALGAGVSLASLAVTGGGVHPWVAGAVLVVTGVVAARLLLSGHRVGTSLRSVRRHHREQLDLLAGYTAGPTPSAGGVGRVSVLETERPLAYCVPGVATSRVVVSRGAVDRLAREELDAVLGHERAHLRARHDLVLEAFSVLHRAFPRVVSSAAALREVRILVEVDADRTGARLHGPRPLARALVALATGHADPAVADAALRAGSTSDDLIGRIDLLGARPARLQATLVATAAVAVIVLPTVFVALTWLQDLWV